MLRWKLSSKTLKRKHGQYTIKIFTSQINLSEHCDRFQTDDKLKLIKTEKTAS